MRRNKAEQSAAGIDMMRVKLDTKMSLIIREQEQVITACTEGINRLNSDMKAIRKRLNPEGPYDERFYELKDRYENKLAERAVLENARTMAEESITAAKLHTIPGEIDRREW